MTPIVTRCFVGSLSFLRKNIPSNGLTAIYRIRSAIGLCAFLGLSLVSPVMAAIPDLTGAGAIAALRGGYVKLNPSDGFDQHTYNLGATGLRGWIYVDGNNAGNYGLMTEPSRQILVTAASEPGSAVLAVNDVILGAVAGSTGSVPLFTSDCRKALGVAIGEAEKGGVGSLRVKRWRAGTVSDQTIVMTPMDSYSQTAPYTCLKSDKIFANARNKLVSQLMADPNFLSTSGYTYEGAVKGLALLASVAPGDANYAAVQTRLQTYARSLAAFKGPTSYSTWNWGYVGIFLSEYYLRTVADGAPDASVLPGLNQYIVALTRGQSRYGTFGHGDSLLKADGGLHGTVAPYGPVNAAGLPANIAIVLAKKAILASGGTLDPEIDPAIQRGANFFGYYVNKGSIPYGEHEPWVNGHSSNGKDPMCAVLFGLQAGRLVETEYFTRMSVAGFSGREYGHTGQGWSYLWGPLGANMGGPTAVAKFMENVRWHSDLARRTDGSFAYDGVEQYGGGRTADDTYLGASNYYTMNATAIHLLSYAVKLKRLYITGRDLIPANTLSEVKVTNAIAAATYKQDCVTYSVPQLMTALGEYDPVVRNDMAVELATRPLTTEVDDLIALITNGTMMSADPNIRQSACQTLGIRQAMAATTTAATMTATQKTAALTALGQRLSDPDKWVRAKAAKALQAFGPAASPQLTPMLTAMTTNFTDPDLIDWSDPIQISNGYLAAALFKGDFSTSTIDAAKNLLHPAVKVGLKQPDSQARNHLSSFSMSKLTLADVKLLIPDLIQVINTNSQADTMWTAFPRAAGITTLAKYKITEGIALGLAMQQIPTGFGWGSSEVMIPGLNALAAYGDAARWTLPTLKSYLFTWKPETTAYSTLVNAIATIEGAITSPILVPGLPVAQSQVVTTEVARAIVLTGYDSAADPLTYAIVTQPSNGILTGTPPNMTYTPAANFFGTDRFTFKTNDGTSDSEPGTVSLIVGVAGTGLKGEYYNNINFTALKATRTDPMVNFDWSSGSPHPLVAPDGFSVRWTGKLLAPETASYRFSTLNSDGVRLWVNGVQVLEDYNDHAVRWNDGVPINLTAGQKYDLVMEYYENTGSAAAKLKWSGPSFAGANGVIISDKWLYDGSAVTNRAPVALAQNTSVLEDTAKAITLGGGDPFFDSLTYTIVTQPTHGILSGTTPNLTYTPAANYNGTDSFTFTVKDGAITSAATTVGLTITPVNDATVSNSAATYASYTATTATLNGTLSCDEASYSVYAYWGTTDGGSTIAQWQNSALVGTRSNVTASALSRSVTGLTANTRYYFTFRAVSAAGELWASNVMNFGPSPAGDLLSFGLPKQSSNISGLAVTWPVNAAAVITSLAPTYTLSPGATCNKASGSTQNFTTPVTYTVTAQNGVSKIYTVKVIQLPNATFTWNSSSSGNWSTASKWLNESVTAAAPAAGGQSYYNLNFTNTGSYTATHDLGTGFLLNRLNFGGPTVTLAGTSSLTLAPWDSPLGVIAPQVNQNGSNAVTINNPLRLASNLTFGGTGTGEITLKGLVGGGSVNDGTLVHTGANVLFLDNANNGYPGGLEVINSTLKATVGVNKAFGGQLGNWQGTRMKLTNSTLQLMDGGWCSAGFELLGTNTITQTNAPYTCFVGGLTGSGLLNLTGNYPIAFNGNDSTYSGDIRISQGPAAYVKCGGVDALGSGGSLIMATAGGVKMGIESSLGATLDNYIKLETPLNFSWTYNNMVFVLKRDISGPGSLSKVYDAADTGTHLELGGLNSTYSGGTFFKSGHLEVRGGNSLGTGKVTLGGKASAMPNHVVTFTNLAVMTIPNDFVLAGISEPSLTELAAVTTFSVPQSLQLSGNLSGTGGLRKIGSQTLTLSGINTCSGPVKVEAGVIAYTRAVSVGRGTLDITAGAKVQLEYEGTRQISALTFDGGSALPNGTYGSSISLAANKDNSRFSGPGMVTISSVPTVNSVMTLALTSGASPSASGTFLTFTATVAGSAPTGTVNFYCGGALIGSGVLNGSFQASVTTPSLSQGWQYLTAVYLGDATNLLDVSEPLEQFVGQPLPNAVPVAIAQNASTMEDIAKAITLAGSDADGNVLTYIVVTAPAYGQLSGTGPNLTYTPNANYTGTDSFAFYVNDGLVSSPVATVSLTIMAVSEVPVAFAQSVRVGINSGKAITLVATDADGGALTYTIVSQPTKGLLSGTIPNLVYTPTTDYSGPDSFSFRASDGINNSATVTVSIDVSNSVFTWNSAVAGNWSDISKWAVGSGAPVATGRVGDVLDFTKSGNYTVTHDLNAGFLLNQLSFAGTVTLAGSNSMILSASAGILPQIDQRGSTGVIIGNPVELASNVTLGGLGSGNVMISGVISGAGMLIKNNTGVLTLSQENSYLGGTVINTGTLSLVTNLNSPLSTGPVTLNSGATLALDSNSLANNIQFNGGTVTNSNSFASNLSGLITLAGTPTFDMSGGFVVTGNMSGPGGLKKAGTNTVLFSGANRFTGAVTVKAGGLQIASLNRVSGGTATSNLGAPTTVVAGTISLGDTTTTGTIKYVGTGETTDRIINLAGTTGGAVLDQSSSSGLLTFSSNVSVTGAGAKTLTLQGSTSGRGKLAGAIVNSSGGVTGLTKLGSGTWTLAGDSSYSGATQVTAGTLVCATVNSLGSGALNITTGAALDLNYVGTRQVASLTYDLGGPQANGTYGSTTSSATFQNDTYFVGTGTVTVGPLVGGTTTALVRSAGSSPSSLGAPLTFTATVLGGSPTGSVTFYDGATALGTSTLTSDFQATFSSSTLVGGNHNIVAQYTGNGIYTASTSAVLSQVITPSSSYEAWASNSAQKLTAGVNDSPLADPDGDGISNLVEFALGGGPMTSSPAILPILTKPTADFAFEYDRSDAAQFTTLQIVEYGSDLTGWTPVTIPATSAGSVQITPGIPTDRIKVMIPNGGARTFVRLKVTR